MKDDTYNDFFDALAKLSRPKVKTMKEILEQDALLYQSVPVKKMDGNELTIKTTEG